MRFKAGLCGALLHRRADAERVGLHNRPASLADKEARVVRLVVAEARDEGVERTDAVNKSVLDEKIQRAIDGRRRGGFVAFVSKFVENFICADGRMIGANEFENAPPRWGKATAARGDFAFGGGDRIFHARGVIVRG